LSQIHFITPSAIGARGPNHALPAQTVAQGEFRGLARWMTKPYASRTPVPLFERHPEAGIDAQSEDPRDASDSLSALLAAIDDEVSQHAAAACDGVMADFAARVAHARRHLSPHLLAATLAAIKEQRKAALALIKRNAATERAGRKKAAIMAAAGRRRATPERRGRRNDPPGGTPAPK
jgi:hypothetical protein